MSMAACAPGALVNKNAVEISGIAVRANEFIVVSDNEPGVFYRAPYDPSQGPRFAIENERAVRLKDARLAFDLEGVELLLDNKVIVLSPKRLRSLIVEDGTVYSYESYTSEIGNRGLEGVAVHPTKPNLIAVVWEGGYPEPDDLPPALRQEELRKSAIAPFIITHEINAAVPAGSRVNVTGQVTTLNVPKPAGEAPDAQRFRAPDLVWYPQPNGEDEFIVLVSSQNSPLAGDRAYGYIQLIRFDKRGQVVGDPFDVKAALP